MPVEIERKFLVSGTPSLENGVPMVQGYLCHDIERTIRVRTEGTRAVITIKSATKGISRAEFEYEIPREDAKELLAMAVSPVVRKTRYYHKAEKHVWEIDVFEGENQGLIVAEIELNAEDEEFEKPEWIGKEVSEEARYSNSSLARMPYSRW